MRKIITICLLVSGLLTAPSYALNLAEAKLFFKKAKKEKQDKRYVVSVGYKYGYDNNAKTTSEKVSDSYNLVFMKYKYDKPINEDTKVILSAYLSKQKFNAIKRLDTTIQAYTANFSFKEDEFTSYYLPITYTSIGIDGKQFGSGYQIQPMIISVINENLVSQMYYKYNDSYYEINRGNNDYSGTESIFGANLFSTVQNNIPIMFGARYGSVKADGDNWDRDVFNVLFSAKYKPNSKVELKSAFNYQQDSHTSISRTTEVLSIDLTLDYTIKKDYIINFGVPYRLSSSTDSTYDYNSLGATLGMTISF